MVYDFMCRLSRLRSGRTIVPHRTFPPPRHRAPSPPLPPRSLPLTPGHKQVNGRIFTFPAPLAEQAVEKGVCAFCDELDRVFSSATNAGSAGGTPTLA